MTHPPKQAREFWITKAHDERDLIAESYQETQDWDLEPIYHVIEIQALESLREECERLRESGRHAQNTLNDMLGLKHDFEVLGLTLILEYIKRDDLQAANEKLRAEVAEKHEAYTIAFKQAMENGEKLSDAREECTQLKIAVDKATDIIAKERAEKEDFKTQLAVVLVNNGKHRTEAYTAEQQRDAALAKALEYEALLQEWYYDDYDGPGLLTRTGETLAKWRGK